jgi:hypothetical protein
MGLVRGDSSKSNPMGTGAFVYRLFRIADFEYFICECLPDASLVVVDGGAQV